MTVQGRELLAFAGCNYLALGYHPRVVEAARQGLHAFGISTTASRETTGNTRAHEELEVELARFTGEQDAILLAEGYTANFAVCQALAPTIGVALLDARAHRSLRNAAMAAGMQIVEYEHASVASARSVASRYADAGVAILSDSVFAANGAMAPLPELLDCLPRSRSALVVDDCHGFCVLGPAGEGAVRHHRLDDPRVVITTTLAKGLGCYGGAVLGRRDLVANVRHRSGVYRGSTPVPPALAMAAREGVAIIAEQQGGEGSLLASLRDRAAQLRERLASLSLAAPAPGIPIFAFALEESRSTPGFMARVHERVLGEGILAPFIEYPGGPGPRFFRLVVNAGHTRADIDRLADSLARAIALG